MFQLIVGLRNVEHGFDYEMAPVYNLAAAVDAWNKTIAFLDERLKRR